MIPSVRFNSLPLVYRKYVIHFNAVMSLKDHLDTFQEVKKLKIRHGQYILLTLINFLSLSLMAIYRSRRVG